MLLSPYSESDTMDPSSTSSVIADPIPSTVRLGESLCCPFRLSPDAPVDLGNLKSHLEAKNVETRPIIAGNLAKHPAAQRFKTRSATSLAGCDNLLRRGFMIGCHPVLDDQAFETLEAAFYSLSTL
jgi:dTDP-4-amino-4,6-dideoxygalactose transaminase